MSGTAPGDLQHIVEWADGLLANLEPAARRRLARLIATDLRRSQQQRIRAQLNADGSPYAPRKKRLRGRKGAIRRAMFAKLRTARYMKIEADDSHAAVIFASEVERIVRVHQLGLRDRVGKRGPEYQYPVRELLGFTDEDVRRIGEMLETRLG